MPMRCYFLTRQVAIKFWPVYKSRSIFWTDFEDLKGRLIHRKIRYEHFDLIDTTNQVQTRGVGDSHIQMTGVLLGVKNAVLVPFRVFSFKTSSVVAFVVPVRVEIR